MAGGDAEGGTSGESAGAGAGNDAGVAGASGETGLGPDPDPFTDEPDGVVETSGSYVVFERNLTELFVLDLEGEGEPVQVNFPQTALAYSSRSDDGSFLIYSRGGAPTEMDLYLNVFTASGYVPSVVVNGFEGRPGLHAARGFDAGSRFVSFSRTGATRGLDIVDAARNRRHFSTDIESESLGFDWAPKGYLFALTVYRDVDVPEPVNRDVFVAKLTHDGISRLAPLPASVAYAKFDHEGRRLFYSTRNDPEPRTFGYVEPPLEPRTFYESPDSIYTAGDFVVEAGAESVLAVRPDPDGSAGLVVRRLFVDPTRPPETISGAPSASAGVGLSASGRLAALSSYAADGTLGLALLREGERFEVVAPAALESLAAEFAGEALVYTLNGSEVHAVTLEGDQVLDTIVSDPAYNVQTCTQLTPVPNKVFYRFSEPTAGLRVVDLEVEGSGAGRTIGVSDPAGRVSCPTFSANLGALVYTETTDDSEKLFVVHFTPEGPSEPELVFESEGDLQPLILRP